VARVRALLTVAHTRLDLEGVHEADVDAWSHPAFKKWRASLSPKDLGLLTIYRAGAVTSGTRAQHGAVDPCRYCGHALPSMRHYWQECPRFHSAREEAADSCESAFFPPGFWAAAPRCTSKSGWITLSAHRSATSRALLGIAACKVALAIMRAYSAEQEEKKKSGSK
jgi:hypothetical protein